MVGLASITGKSRFADFNYPSDLSSLTVTDIETLRDGSYRVIGVLADRDTEEAEPNTGERAANSTIQIKSRLISSAGVASTTEAYSWTLLNKLPGHSNSNTFRNDFTALLAQADAGTGVTVLGKYDNEKNDERVYAFKLSPGVRPVGSTPFSDTGIVATKAVRSDYGFYYIADDAGRVARYRPNFRRDTGFARRGVGSTDAGVNYRLVADENGDVLTIGETVIQRLA